MEAPLRRFSHTPAFRLATPADFRRVMKTGRRCTDELFTVIVVPSPGPVPRLGIAVSRKVARSAVRRNRIKRLVRETFRHHRGDLPAVDVMVLARPEAAAADNPTVVRSLQRHFHRIQMTCAG